MEETTDRLRVSYLLTCSDDEDPAVKAREIALEQTVELPEGCLTAEIESLSVGRVERIDQLDAVKHEAVISYDPVTIGGEIPQLFNLIFGNISLKSGILVQEIAWPTELLDALPGPRYGIPKLRELCGVVEQRPLICAALKPLGSSATELAALCTAFARGGIDIIKDDHGLADQRTAPFAERVARCQEAVEEANARSGGKALYFPHLPGTVDALDERLAALVAHGCRGLLLSPLLIGPDRVRALRETTDLAILSHPALCGAFFRADHGIAPELLLGQIFRLLGSDGVIYPNSGGRFELTHESCVAINARLREPLGNIEGAFPIPGGGIEVERVPSWIEQFGADTIFLIGGSLYKQPELLESASRELLEAVRDALS